jgi:hypothetical protein
MDPGGCAHNTGSLDHSALDPGSLDHGALDHSALDPGSLDHSALDHNALDDSSLYHNSLGVPAADEIVMAEDTFNHCEPSHVQRNGCLRCLNSYRFFNAIRVSE